MDPSRTETSDFVPTAFLPNPYAGINKDPALRWRRVEYLVMHRRRPFSTRDDRATWAAWRFLRLWRRCHTDAGREHLAQHFPAIAEAHAVFTGEVPLRRAELEARILGRQTDDEIASKLGLTAAGVGVYADLFFDVRGALTADIYITLTVLGPKVLNGLQADDRELLLKAFGFELGGPGVDALLDYFRHPPVVPASLDGLDLVALKDLHRRLHTHLRVLAVTTPASTAPVATWLWLQKRLADVTRSARGGDDGKDVSAVTQGVLDLAACLGDLERVIAGAVKPEPVAVPA